MKIKTLTLGLFMTFGLSLGLSAQSVKPGSIEAAGNKNLDKVIAAAAKVNVADDEVGIFYFREDGKYEPKGLWLWRYPDGNGDKNWKLTQKFNVQDGVAYLKFKKDGSNAGEQPLVGTQGEIGFIVRNADGWTGQTKDFIWNVKTKGNKVVYFENAAEPDPVAPYKPTIKGAQASAPNKIRLDFSGRFGLDTQVGSSGFVIQTLDGKKIEVKDAVNADAPDARSNNNAKAAILTLAQDLEITQGYSVSHPAFYAPEKVDTGTLVTLMADRSIPAPTTELGAIYDKAKKSVTFRLWAPTASAVTLKLYDKSLGADPKAVPIKTIASTFDKATGVWTGTYGEKDPLGLFYEYSIKTSKGEMTALDPYAKSMDTFIGSGAGRGAVVDSASLLPEGGWVGGEALSFPKKTDAVIYEVSVRDFTISPDSGVTPELKGTYKGFIEKIPYLKQLGITHVQLLPVLNFYFTNENKRTYEDSGKTNGNNYNWGYDPHNYFSPEGWYSTNPSDPALRIVELKTLIKELHKAGIGVILDVVYNHVAMANLLDDIVPNYFFRKDAKGMLLNNSGCGNDVNSSATMARRLIGDSLEYWTREFKVDGFRFDLMGLIDADTILAGYKRSAAVNPSIIFEGEGWKNYNGPNLPGGMMNQDYMTKTDSVAVFNDEIRNLIKAGGLQEKGKGYVTKKEIDKKQMFMNLTGRPQKNYTADNPGDSMLYVAAHDNLDLHDAVAFNTFDGKATPGDRPEIASRVKLANFLILTGQGLVFLHGGQEKLRTKPNLKKVKAETLGEYVRNSYDSSDNINQILWTMDDQAAGTQAYVQGLIALRKANGVFRLGSAEKIDQSAVFIEQSGGYSFSYSLKDGSSTWYILSNADTKAATLKFPEDLSKGQIFVDRKSASNKPLSSPDGVKINGKEVTLEGLTAAVIKITK